MEPLSYFLRDMRTENLVDGHLKNLTLTFKPFLSH